MKTDPFEPRPATDEDPEPGKTSIRLGAAFMQPYDKEHIALYRKLILVKNEDGMVTRTEMERPIGPLGIYRRGRDGEKGQIRSMDPTTGEPLELVLVWRPDSLE